MATKELIPGRPVWWSRHYIEPFVLEEDEIDDLIRNRRFAAVSWVTKTNEPVTALMSYVWMDDHIWVTSTTNRHKFQAWRRNPSICLCIWDADDTQKQVTVRGHVELIKDDEIHRRFIEELLRPRREANDWNDDEYQRQFSTFSSPDRWFVKVTIDRVRSFNGNKMRQAEDEGIDVWGEWDFPQGR